MCLKSALEDWLHRRQLRRARIAPELSRPLFTAGAHNTTCVVDPSSLSPRSAVYSFGLGADIDWELAMVDRFACRVHAFDPTVRGMVIPR